MLILTGLFYMDLFIPIVFLNGKAVNRKHEAEVVRVKTQSSTPDAKAGE